jgi:glycosyltransferase involved in cell wall biosynthesis
MTQTTTAKPLAPLVTIITPTFNRPELLFQAVESVTKQTYRSIEHIIVGDNCPMLETIEVKEKLFRLNPALRLTNLKPGEPITYGPARIARVRNAGIDLTNGDFIAHLDDDNTFDADHVEGLLEAFNNCPEAVMTFSYRKLLIEGIEPYLYSYHPWSPDLETARKVYEVYSRMGIYQTNSHLMRDRISFHEERDCTLDTNEMMIKREFHQIFKFKTDFSEAMKEQELGEDDVFCEEVYRQGYRVAASGRFSLNFRVGGRFTQSLLHIVETNTCA